MTPLINSLIGTFMVLLMGGYVFLGGSILMWIDEHAKHKKTLSVLTVFLWIWGIMLVVALGSK